MPRNATTGRRYSGIDVLILWGAVVQQGNSGQSWLTFRQALSLGGHVRKGERGTTVVFAHRSIVGLFGLCLRVPDHTTLSRRAATLEVPRPRSAHAGAGVDSEPMHLLVDSTGLKLCGKGEWLLEKHGTATRRSWRTLHLGVDAGTGRIVASTLSPKGVDDASQVDPLLDQVPGPLASFTGDGAYDQDRVYAGVAERHPEAAVCQRRMKSSQKWRMKIPHFITDQSRPHPRGGSISASSVRSRSTMACKDSAVAVSRRASGRASAQAT